MPKDGTRGRGWYLREADPDERKRIAAMGGRARKGKGGKGGGNGFVKGSELAKRAGRLGGLSVPREKRVLVSNPELGREIARLGGIAAQKKRREEKAPKDT